MTLLIYARGGGIGHVNRAFAIAQVLQNRHGISPLLLATSPLIPYEILANAQVMRWPWQDETLISEHMAPFIRRLAPQALLVDTFEQGPEGELASLELPRWVIQRDGEVPLSSRHFLVKPQGVGYVLNTAPQAVASRTVARDYWQADPARGPLVVVAHNGDPQETRSFFEGVSNLLSGTDYQVRFASLLPCLKPVWREQWCSPYPLAQWYAGVDLLIGGGGYNLVAEAQCYGVRGLFYGFERPVDQQWDRIASLPHFHWGMEKTLFLARVQEVLLAPPPRPESHCQGAEKIAQILAEHLQKA